MLELRQDVFYYITVMNENYSQPSLPQGVTDGIIKGMYRLSASDPASVRLLGSGAILREVMAAAELLRVDWLVNAEVWSVTSFSELAREARETQRANRLNSSDTRQSSYVSQCLGGTAPVIAATDYVAAYPSLIAPFVKAPFTVLGTDGFGRSDTRANLRRFFEVDRHQIVVAALRSLADQGTISASVPDKALKHYSIETTAEAPWTR
jgi:pyruvate dehydrogenase E1 component